MTEKTWIDWCGKQLADLSQRLFRQGYHPARIMYLNESNPEFRKAYAQFLTRMDMLMDEMANNPQGYHHYDAFSRVKAELLNFTNLNRAHFLEIDLAESA